MKRTLTVLAVALAVLMGPGALETAQAVTDSGEESAVADGRPFPLMVGDKAPPMAVGAWTKGGPVDSFEEGRVYIVDFWATWCRPCLESIAHIVELQERFKDKATVIGMNIWQPDPESVTPFVEKMGEKMPYAVATDDVPEGESANKGKMAQSWMAAAGQMGIPAVFIIDGDGRVAWIGHPSEVDEPLERIVKGVWDIDGHAIVHRTRMEKVAKAAPIQERLHAAMEKENWSEAVKACEELIAVDPDEFADAAMYKFQILLQQMGSSTEAYAYGREIVEGLLGDKQWALNGVAWMIVDPEFDTDNRDLDLALKAAKRADELTGGEKPEVIDTLARVYFARGDVKKAINLQKRAVKLVDEGENGAYQKTLDEYEKAASE